MITNFLRSLRGRLIVLTVIVEVVMISAIVWNSQRLSEAHLVRQFELRRLEIATLLRSALAPAMAQRDYAEIADTLDEARQVQGMIYLAMFDENDQRVATSATFELGGQTTVELLRQLPEDRQRLDFHIPMSLESQDYGQLLVGLDLRFLEQARREMLLQNMLIAVLGILASTAILATIALWLTRRLTALSGASHALALGRPFAPLEGAGPDDIGLLIDAFNRMGSSLLARMGELEAAEQTQRELAEKLLFMAERDPLTGLANRARFDIELERLLEHHLRHRNEGGALLYFDIDEFKTINDTFGHRAGDQVLLRIAEAVGRLVRSEELFARLGGDEFVVLAPSADRDGAQALAERIVGAVRAAAFDIAGHRLGLTISLGIALYPQHGDNPEALVSHADAAMYQAKAGGKNGWRIYRPELDDSEDMLHQLGWNDGIQRALAERRLVLHFQGIHDVFSGSCRHYEALVRMIDPQDPTNLLMPGSFIPAAERTGRIVDIDRWVIRDAIRTLAEHPALDGLAINISARSFDEPGLARQIRETLLEFQVAPHRLIIELTETAALANIGDSEQFIHDIRALGCTVCLDDFGVGFSSFAYLKQLSADVLKIDGMFIRNLVSDPDDQVFVRAIVEVARGLGKTTVAEFVGDAATLAILRDLGVDCAQGYHLSRPSPESSLP